MKNKKGDAMVIIIFFCALAIILFLGFIMLIGSSVLNWVWDVSAPELTNLGMVDNANNFTQYASYTITPANNFIQSLTWLTGVLFILMLFGSFGFIVMYGKSPSKWLITLYFSLAILLIILSVFVSNIYEDFSNDSGELAIRLNEHTLLNYMILYSPSIFTIMTFVTGIVLFSGIANEEEN